MNIKRKGQLPSMPRNKIQGEYTKKNRYSKSHAIKYLEELAMDEARRRYPTVPYLSPRTFRDDSANNLTKCILHFLRLKGHQAERINCTGRPIDQRKTFTDVLGNRRTIGRLKWVPGTGTRGTSDISCTISGISIKVEVKVSIDRQSQAQKDYQAAIERAGGLYFVAHTFQEFLSWYQTTFSHE